MIMFPIPEHTRESAAKSASSGRGREEAGRVAKGERTSAYHCVCVLHQALRPLHLHMRLI